MDQFENIEYLLYWFPPQSAVRERSLSSWCCRCCSSSVSSSVSHCASASSWTSLRTRRGNTDGRLIVLLEEGSHTKLRNRWVKSNFTWTSLRTRKGNTDGRLIVLLEEGSHTKVRNRWVKSLDRTPCVKANANAIVFGNGNLICLKRCRYHVTFTLLLRQNVNSRD